MSRASEAQRAAALAETEETARRRIQAMTDHDRDLFLGWQAHHDPYILMALLDKFERSTSLPVFPGTPGETGE